MHVEVYTINGEKVFDNEIRGGNVFDWHLQDGQAQRLPVGSSKESIGEAKAAAAIGFGYPR